MPGFRSVSALASSSAANLTITAPAGLTDGDQIVTGIYAYNGTVSTLAGWTLKETVGTGSGRLYVFSRIASGEGASWTWTCTTAAGNEYLGAAICYETVDAGVTSTAQNYDGASGTQLVTPAVAVGSENDVVLLIGGAHRGAAVTFTCSFTERLDGTGNGDGLCFYDSIRAKSASYNPPDITADGASTLRCAASVTINLFYAPLRSAIRRPVQRPRPVRYLQ